jgi:DHA1 family tetracycline resistance protein-like MFS transporter
VKRSPLLPIFLIVLADILGLTIILPLLPFYAETMGASPAVVGLLVSVFAFCQLLSGPFLGRWSDHTGRKPLLLLSQAGTLVSRLLLAGAGTLWVVFLARIIDGLTAGNLVLAQAYISDVTEPQDRTRAFGIIGISFGIGFLLGPAISGALSGFGLAVPILASAALSALSVLATAFLLPAHRPVQDDGLAGPAGRRLSLLAWRQYVEYFRRPGLGRLLLQYFCFVMAFAAFVGGLALFLERRLTWRGHPFHAREVSFVFAYAGLLGISVQSVLGKLVRRFGEAWLVAAGFSSMAIGYGLLAGTYVIPLLLVAGVFAALGSGILRPALTSLITQQVARNEQGVVLGLNTSLQSVAQIVAPAISGLLIDQGLLATWAFFAGACAAAGLLFQRAAPVTRKAPVTAVDR